MKQKGRSKSKLYKNVYFHKINGKDIVWYCSGSINGLKFFINSTSERDAAIKYDMKMIETGREPKNILKRKLL